MPLDVTEVGILGEDAVPRDKINDSSSMGREDGAIMVFGGNDNDDDDRILEN